MTESDNIPGPHEAHSPERSDWNDFGVCVAESMLSEQDIESLTTVLGGDDSPSRIPILQKDPSSQKELPLGFYRLHFARIKGADFLALPVWEKLKQSTLAITDTKRELRWSGMTQYFPATPRPVELPHRDFAMRPKTIAATICTQGKIKATVWPEARGDSPVGVSKTFEIGVGDALLLDMEDKTEEPPYNTHYSWSKLHRFEVGPEEETSSITLDFCKPQLAWTMEEEVRMSFLT